MFTDRIETARLLADRLQAWRGKHPLILAIPRGAVPMARVMAQALDGEFDVVLVRKLRAPHQPELAIGAVDESGWTYMAPHAAAMGLSAAYLEAEKQRQMAAIKPLADEVVCLQTPEDFGAVGLHYRHFPQVEDDEVIELLRGAPSLRA